MRFTSPRFGVIDVDDARILHFPRGLPGFPDCAQFIVMDHDLDTPLKWLQCVDRPEVAFLVVEPEQLIARYQVDIPQSALAFLGWAADRDAPHDVSVFLILNIEDRQLTANLRAPVVVNTANRRALQLVLDAPDLPLRYEISASPAPPAQAHPDREAG